MSRDSDVYGKQHPANKKPIRKQFHPIHYENLIDYNSVCVPLLRLLGFFSRCFQLFCFLVIPSFSFYLLLFFLNIKSNG